MNSTLSYQNRSVVNSSYDSILQFIRPGDVVNQINTHKWWEFWLAIACNSIQSHQKKLFGRDSNWKDTHTMLYFDEHNTFSVEFPKATLKPLKEYCLSDLSIYRLRLVELTDDHLSTMREAAMEMVGENYDVGQLLDIAINSLLGYDHQRRLSIFDFGKKKKVCSVGVRVAFEHLYQKKIKTADSPAGKWLFNTLNPEKWSPKVIAKYKGTDVEATSPAHFANSEFFCHDFELIARFNNGIKLFPK